VAASRVQADLAYGILIGESVDCVATTSTLFWSDLSRDGTKQNKGRNHGCQHKAYRYGIASVFSASLSTCGTIGHAKLHAPV
jgi:hypothetical protein